MTASIVGKISRGRRGSVRSNFFPSSARLSTPQFTPHFLFEAMGDHRQMLACSRWARDHRGMLVNMTAGVACRNMFYSAGTVGFEGWGHRCFACDVYVEHDVHYRMHAAKMSVLASDLNTSWLLYLFRIGSGDLHHRLAHMSTGTLESVMQKHLVRLQRANLRLMLSGRPYGFRPKWFLQLEREWARPFMTGRACLYDADKNCLDLVLDFLLPSDDVRG
jgi:hypothetical protein